MKRTRWIPLIVYAALLVAFLGWISNLFTTSQDTLPYSKVVELFNKEQVRQFVVQDQTITMQLNKPYNGQTTITAPLADPESFRQEMHETFAEQTASGVLESYNFVPDKGFSPYTLILPLLVVGLVILFVWALLMGRMSSAGNPMNGFSKARTVLGVPGDKKVTFDDVAGADEEKEELQEIVDFPRSAHGFPTAFCWWGLPAQARPCLPEQSRERRACSFCPFPARISWKCTWVSAQDVSGTCLNRPEKSPLPSCSSTRSTPSAASAAPVWAAVTTKRNRH